MRVGGGGACTGGAGGGGTRTGRARIDRALVVVFVNTHGMETWDRNAWWFDLQSRISETRKDQSCYVARRK